MFLDIHAHSAATSIFMYCPMPEDERDVPYVRRLPSLLDANSAYFLLASCKWANEKSKRNCARLCIYRDFGILDTYTIESSCWGYEIKGTGNEEEDPEVEQFTSQYFLQFGEHLLFGVARHCEVEVTDLDRAGMLLGFDVELDFCLGLTDSTAKKKVVKKVKKKSLAKDDSFSKQSTNSAEPEDKTDTPGGPKSAACV